MIEKSKYVSKYVFWERGVTQHFWQILRQDFMDIFQSFYEGNIDLTRLHLCQRLRVLDESGSLDISV